MTPVERDKRLKKWAGNAPGLQKAILRLQTMLRGSLFKNSRMMLEDLNMIIDHTAAIEDALEDLLRRKGA